MTVEPSAAPKPPHPLPSGPRPEPGAASWPALQGLDWVSQLPSAAAPGFVYLAGACQGIPVGGGGRDIAEAAARLAGEAAEVQAQTAAPVLSRHPGDAAIDAIWTSATAPLRVAGRRVATGAPVGVPAAAIFLAGPASDERHAAAPPASLGLAAGADAAAARLAGLLEIIERDAAARWWYDGAIPHQFDAALTAAVAADLARLRAGAPAARATALFALPSPTGIPVACALSRDSSGRGLAFGLKAAPDPRAAAAGAIIELLQMELALEMARHRAVRNAATPGDRGPLARGSMRAEDFAALAALPPVPLEAAGFEDFDAVAAALDALGLPVTLADLPARPGGLAIAKVFVPGLRPLPGGQTLARAGAPGAAAPLM